MPRFLADVDYDMQIKQEIRRLLDGHAADAPAPYKLIRAEQTAVSQIRKWLSMRYDCDAIFIAAPEPEELIDVRDSWMVTITIDIALYHLYSQTGNKDVPAHRAQRYQDALDWLKEAGKGLIGTDLPRLPVDDNNGTGDIIIKSRPPENHRW